jgi:hypothetical protein
MLKYSDFEEGLFMLGSSVLKKELSCYFGSHLM